MNALRRFAGLLVSGAAASGAAIPGPGAAASFHFMQVHQVIGGIGGDISAQAVQLRMRTTFQCFLSSGATLWVRDATGDNPVLLADFASNVSGCDEGDHVLLVTEAVARLAGGQAEADFILQNPIPPAYLIAGSMTFEDDLGAVLWRLTWGGAAYTGPTGGTLDNDGDGEFGPPYAGPLPSAAATALRFQGGAAAPSSTNAADYALTAGPAVFTNNACEALRLGPPCAADCACPPDGDVGILDLIGVLIAWGAPGGPCDLDGRGTGVTDLLGVLGSWGACP